MTAQHTPGHDWPVAHMKDKRINWPRQNMDADEKLAFAQEKLANTRAARDEFKAQRDELLAALEMADVLLSSIAKAPIMDGIVKRTPEWHPTRRAVAAAIAKAKGGA